jgi:restriction endonuclease Mrr
MFKTAKPAKRRLIKILQEKKKEIAKDIEKTIKKVDATKTEELVYDLTEKEEVQNKDEEQKTEETTTE